MSDPSLTPLEPVGLRQFAPSVRRIQRARSRISLATVRQIQAQLTEREILEVRAFMASRQRKRLAEEWRVD